MFTEGAGRRMNLLDLNQAAAQLHCSKRWLEDNLRAGRFPAKKIGRNWVLGDDDIAAILQICAVNHTPAFSADSCATAAASSSMTPTTARRLRQK
jgi:hypothetical protein